jgi:hypothetical protein
MLTAPDQDSADRKMLGENVSAPARPQAEGKPEDTTDYLDLAEQCFEMSKNYYESFLRSDWRASLSHFKSEHASGSKYHKVEYAKRSRTFRPKTRSMVLRKEASAAGAFFAQEDAATISPADPDNLKSRASAAVMNAILNHRLKVTIPWFMILQGNYQTALVQGVCASKQYWDYKSKQETVQEAVPVLNEDGTPVLGPDDQPLINYEAVQKNGAPEKDEPRVVPIPPENLRFHPSADWLDPVGTSPYLIYAFPMFVIDVKSRSSIMDPKTNQPTWKAVTDDQLATAARLYAETLNVRDNKRREVEQAPSKKLKDYDTVWVHENILKREDGDVVFYTLGVEALLSDPRPLKEVYLHGVRPFAVGIASLEAFQVNPQSKVQQLSPVQKLTNEIANQRIDNVRLAMNGRYWVRDGKKVDLQVLTHSTPGSAVLMSDPQTDVKWDRPQDVTASAYQEQDRINVDFDDLAGIMSTGTVQSDRKLNETVGGMNIMSSDANAVQEYELRIFATTYVEKVLDQLVLLEQAYETDLMILSLGGKQAQSMTKFGVDPVQDDLMTEKLLVTVSVGIGSTAPAQRMDKLAKAFQTFWGIAGPLVDKWGPPVLQSPGVKRMASEIFGAAGYKDVDQFLDFGPAPPPPGDPAAEGQKPGIDPQIAQQALEVEQSEGEKDRATKLAETRIKDMGQTTRTIIQAHKDMIIKGVMTGVPGGGSNVVDLRPNGVPPIPPQAGGPLAG